MTSPPPFVSTPSRGQMFDRFGFLQEDPNNTNSNSTQQEPRSHNYYNDGLERSTSAQRVWNKLIDEWGTRPQEKLEEHLKAGVPRNLRGKVWAKILDIQGAREHATFSYAESLKICIEIRDSRLSEEDSNDEKRREWAAAFGTPRGKGMKEPKDSFDDDGRYPSAKSLKQIQLDLDRTFYNHSLLMIKDGPGQQSLFNMLAVYARVNRAVGYCQGMAYIAAVLLMNLPEEEAFWGFYVLMESPNHFVGYFDEKLTRVQHEAALFEEILSFEMPDLSKHMKDMCIHPLMYVTPWLMCAFTALPLWDTVLAIWDMMLFKGTISLTRTALTVMTSCKSELLACDSLGELLPYLQHVPASKTKRPVFVKAIWKVKDTHLNSLIERAELSLKAQAVANASAKARQASTSVRKQKRLHSQMEAEPSTPVTKRSRENPTTGGPAPTPSVFRRFMNSLATPLRQRARMDGAETPVSRIQKTRSLEALPLAPNFSTPAPKMKKMDDLTSLRTPKTEAMRTPLTNASPFNNGSPFNSPFNHSGFLSPSYTGKVPTALTHAVTTLMSPSKYANLSPSVYATTDLERTSFASFKEPTPRRTSPVSCLARKETEMETIKENGDPNVVKGGWVLLKRPVLVSSPMAKLQTKN
eukprot:m.10316 g.10316  ORF g.10316 m.10316 type:complete len:638 (-) comp8245_c0_seq1:227-2140(-)